MTTQRKCHTCQGEVNICISCGKEICLGESNEVAIKIEAINPTDNNSTENPLKVLFYDHSNYNWGNCYVFILKLCPSCYKRENLETKIITFEQLQKITASFVEFFIKKEKGKQK